MSQPIEIFRVRLGGNVDDSVSGVPVTGANTYYSTPISGAGGDGFSLHLEWTGTPDGQFTVWKSNKPFPNLATDADWVQDQEFNSTGNVAAHALARGEKHHERQGHSQSRLHDPSVR
jgi:hypothetical protein